MELNNVASQRAFLEELSTADLSAMLRAELGKEELDDNLIRLILDVLENREIDHPVDIDANIADAVEKFEKSINIQRREQARSRWPRVLKVASIILVVGLLLFVVPQAANAESIFEMLARWTDSIFEFFSPDGDNNPREYVFETDHPGLRQIYDAVVEIGVTDPVVPMWVPDGFELDEVKIIKEQSASSLYASMKYSESEISITIFVQSAGSPLNHMKDIDNIEIFEAAGWEHYIISNNEKTNAVWVVNNIQCSVATDCREEELYKILESIYTTEA